METERWEVSRDDGDDAIGWGYSYAYYEFTADGKVYNMNREFTKRYEEVTADDMKKRYRIDMAAIKGEETGARYAVWARKLPMEGES